MEEGRNAEAETGQRDHWTTGPRDGGATGKHRETTKTIVLWSVVPQCRFPVFPFSRCMVVAVTLQAWHTGGERVC